MRPFESPRSAAGPRRYLALAGLVGAVGWPTAFGATAVPDVPAASQRAAPAPAPVSVERLKALVPARAGRWTRLSLAGPEPGKQEPDASSARAEFGSGSQRIVLTVFGAGPQASAPFSGAPLRETTADERRATYREGRATVIEKVRRIDRQAEVTLLRDDGIVVVAQGTGIETVRLKEVAKAVGAHSKRR